jgi:hypothetical protein
MAIDVFVSYSHADKATADAACAMLEGSGVRCWIAPRDIPPGSQWAGAVISAIDHCRVMVLIFSAQANISNQIHREVERAISKGIPVIPLRIEEVNPTNSMEYYLGAIHWLDALTPPLEEHLQRLTETVKSYLDVNQAGDLPARSDAAKLAAVGPNAASTTPAPPQRMRDGASHQDRAASNWGTGARGAALGALCLLIAVGGGAVLYHFEYAQGTKLNPAAEVAIPPLQQQSAAVPVDQPNVTLPRSSRGGNIPGSADYIASPTHCIR